jgi:hypothetical protein
METFRRLINKSKLLTNNSNFTLQVSNIDGTELKPLVSDKNLLAHIDDVEDAEILAKLNSRNKAKLIKPEGLSVNPDLRITKLDKPIEEMDSAERRIAAEKIAEVMLDQANKYKKKE